MVKQRFAHLDGLRGWLALWVMLGHSATIVGCKVPILTKAAIAVDIFIILSGFFVSATFNSLSKKLPIHKAILYFYIKRFFRVWPLYIFLLLTCWYFLDYLSEFKMYLAYEYPPPWALNKEYLVKPYELPNNTQILSHVTMLFGIWPSLSVSSPLPDWSLSLEFQYYLLFPLLFWFLPKSYFWLSCFAMLLGFFAQKVGGLYLEPGLITHFHQPSNIIYKLHIFLIGLILHKFSLDEKYKADFMMWLSLMFCVVLADPITAFFIILTIALFLGKSFVPTRLLTNSIMLFLGKISYTIYLCHMLVVIPIAYCLSKYTNFTHYSSLIRFALVVLICLPMVIILSASLHKMIESKFNDFAANLTKL